jgi:hypothetical protein
MKAMENGVYETTQLINESKGGQAVMNINQICELDQYQEATLRTWNANNDFGGRVLNAALGLTGYLVLHFHHVSRNGIYLRRYCANEHF